MIVANFLGILSLKVYVCILYDVEYVNIFFVLYSKLFCFNQINVVSILIYLLTTTDKKIDGTTRLLPENLRPAGASSYIFEATKIQTKG